MNTDFYKRLFEQGASLGEVMQSRLNFDKSYDMMLNPRGNKLSLIRTNFKLDNDVEVYYYRQYSSNEEYIFLNSATL